MADLKPEAAYFFADDNGNRSGSIVFDLKEKLIGNTWAVAEPWFLAFNERLSLRRDSAGPSCAQSFDYESRSAVRKVDTPRP